MSKEANAVLCKAEDNLRGEVFSFFLGIPLTNLLKCVGLVYNRYRWYKVNKDVTVVISRRLLSWGEKKKMYLIFFVNSQNAFTASKHKV